MEAGRASEKTVKVQEYDRTDGGNTTSICISCFLDGEAGDRNQILD